MLTATHFEAIGKVVYRSTIMESRICYLLTILQKQDLASWSQAFKAFRFPVALGELRGLTQSAHPSLRDHYVACLDEAEDLNERRNDIVHGLWQLSAEDLFGSAAQDVLGAGNVSRGVRIPVAKNSGEYSIFYTAEDIESVARRMQTLTVQLVELTLRWRGT